jgi:hypothetical protein
MPVSVFSVNKELSSPSKSLRSPRARPAPPPHAPPRRPRPERRGCGWRPRPTTPSALARPLRPPRRTSHRLGTTPTEHRIYIHKELNLPQALYTHDFTPFATCVSRRRRGSVTVLSRSLLDASLSPVASAVARRVLDGPLPPPFPLPLYPVGPCVCLSASGPSQSLTTTVVPSARR